MLAGRARACSRHMQAFVAPVLAARDIENCQLKIENLELAVRSTGRQFEISNFQFSIFNLRARPGLKAAHGSASPRALEALSRPQPPKNLPDPRRPGAFVVPGARYFRI